MLDVESQEGIIKAAVKRVAHSFMEAEDSAEIGSAKKRKRKLTSNRVKKSTVLLWLKRWRPLDCTDRRGRSQRDRAVDSFIAMTSSASVLGHRPRNSRRKHERTEDFSPLAQQRETVRRVLGSHDSYPVSLQLPQTVTGHRKISVLDCARKTGAFAARRKAIGRPDVRISSTARMERLPPLSQD